MKTNKLPQSDGRDPQAAGSQSQTNNKSSTYYATCDKEQKAASASNDDSYQSSQSNNNFDSNKNYKGEAVKNTLSATASGHSLEESLPIVESGYKKPVKTFKMTPTIVYKSDADTYSLLDEGMSDNVFEYSKETVSAKEKLQAKEQGKTHPAHYSSGLEANSLESDILLTTNHQIPERVFMNGLIKHTAIALAIIIPLAAFSAYAAAPQNVPLATSNTKTESTGLNTSATLAVKPSDIIHNSANTPTSVDSVDLSQYAGTWYEIGRLPMYFQRNCDSNVTATYTGSATDSNITVLNQCSKKDGSAIKAEGIAKPVDSSGSKLKVTFLPSWLRWLPVGKADYWVLARDADYNTALVGTPNKKYLWLLARTPDISQQTYTKYRQIAQEQGYDLKEFKLTTQSKQSVTLVP